MEVGRLFPFPSHLLVPSASLELQSCAGQGWSHLVNSRTRICFKGSVSISVSRERAKVFHNLSFPILYDIFLKKASVWKLFYHLIHRKRSPFPSRGRQGGMKESKRLREGNPPRRHCERSVSGVRQSRHGCFSLRLPRLLA